MRNAENAFQRDTYWDVVKALLIFLVILGHVIQFFVYQGENESDFWSDPLFKGIYLFHMPLFMLISGYFAAKSVAKRAWQVLPRYLLRLALPCLSMGGLFALAAILLNKDILTEFGRGALSLWFLIVIFECLLCYLIMQLTTRWWWRAAAFVIPILLAIRIGNLPQVSFLWPHHQQFTYLWPIFVLGAGLAALHFDQKHINWRWSAFLLLFAVTFIFFQDTWYVYRLPLTFNPHSLLIDIIRTIAAIAGCGTILWITRYIYPHLGKFALIKNIGRATLALYVLQTVFFALRKFVPLHSILPDTTGYTYALALSCIILFILCAFYRISGKIPFIAILLYGENHKRSSDKSSNL